MRNALQTFGIIKTHTHIHAHTHAHTHIHACGQSQTHRILEGEEGELGLLKETVLFKSPLGSMYKENLVINSLF